MRRLVLVALLAVAGCVIPTEPGECVYAENPNPYGYPGEPIRVCVCPSGATIPLECK